MLVTVLARKIVKKTFEKRGPVLNGIFGPLEAFWDSFGVDFGVILDVLVAQPRSGQNRENHENDDVTSPLKVFSGAGDTKIDDKRDREQLGAPTLLQERLGSLLGPILE